MFCPKLSAVPWFNHLCAGRTDYIPAPLLGCPGSHNPGLHLPPNKHSSRRHSRASSACALSTQHYSAIFVLNSWLIDHVLVNLTPGLPAARISALCSAPCLALPDRGHGGRAFFQPCLLQPLGSGGSVGLGTWRCVPLPPHPARLLSCRDLLDADTAGKLLI